MREFEFELSPSWQATYPGALAGILVLRDVANPSQHTGLDQRKGELENLLRTQFAGFSRMDLRSLPTLQAYEVYYRRYQKTYHVQLQLESIVLKGKAIPRVAALVEAMFMAELQNLLLTAGHDVATLTPPVRLDVANSTEVYTLLNGQEQQLKSGDMFMADQTGVISSILSGPDQRTRISENTRSAFFAVYAPPGIGKDAVEKHLRDIVANAQIISPEARVERLEVLGGG